MVGEESILIVGAGHMGHALERDLPALGISVSLFRGRMSDLDRPPRTIVNAAAKTDVGWCEGHPAEAVRANAIDPALLWRRMRAAWGADARLIHMSSGCIWDGPFTRDGRPFGVGDPPTPVCWYGWSKVIGEALLRAGGTQGLTILRPRLLYSDLQHRRNAIVRLAAYDALIDAPQSVTSVRTVALVIVSILKGDGNGGVVRCVYDRGTVTPYEIGQVAYEAGRRAAPPQHLARAALDAAQRPKRVDVVMYDPWLEEALPNRPRAIEELRRCAQRIHDETDVPVQGKDR